MYACTKASTARQWPTDGAVLGLTVADSERKSGIGVDVHAVRSTCGKQRSRRMRLWRGCTDDGQGEAYLARRVHRLLW
ncbi:hypothetical protein M6B38_317360 [Iris pallida]|uniref:Uncharacterized protein n=1 Tax=Iris pallida TaxID=29817 RepID=A0AAX6HCZ3_IRIPA|nr:hypothetical protein M6B38_317360 [Iris pallida]